MTTDITELAQSMSLRKKLNRRLNDAYGFQRTSGGKHTTISLSIVECKSIIAALDEHLALVEALEKAQQERDNWRTSFDNERFRADKLKAHIDEMTEERTASINELSRIIQKEVKAKREAEKRIAELESRTVKLPKPISVLYRRDSTDAHRAIYAYPEAEVNAALDESGIKWEAE